MPLPNCFVYDSTSLQEIQYFDKESIDTIICDVPCSGSGTWHRNPESALFTSNIDIDNYAKLQREIVENSIPYLSQGGILNYITCSIFQKENEENVSFFCTNFNLKLKEQKLISCYAEGGDALFIAILEKS